ncbi:histidine kinase [Bradyrhizobium sp. 41S5]|uniref:sensor histidine kinase n=1 Tax=Bradyrhizobium sp. 41S5 TaxID=1404443 RepID=UPI00156B7F4E|nr:ATP-binding protein [Bradyrhizobium sp. 41S5]UFX48284.1 histidine kinase [Bradyrhizobium sp. 41S5]
MEDKRGSEFMHLQEELHRKLSEELHDSTCQHLVAASLTMMQVKRAMNDSQVGDVLCEQVADSINLALNELRSLTYLLHPQSFFEDGVKAAIERYADGFAARTLLSVDIGISSEVDRLSFEKQRSVMRIVQEALTNIYRHANATKVSIALVAKGRQLMLEIRDNGRGMVSRDSKCHLRPPSPGTGLRIMQARVQEMGGQLQILSPPVMGHRGTTLRATFPSDPVPKTSELTLGRRSAKWQGRSSRAGASRKTMGNEANPQS